jgi:hypothetical protein
MRLMINFPLLALGLLVSGALMAQVTDPMRPADAPLSGNAASATDGVQAIIMRKGGKPAAIIGGQMVHVGDRLGDKALGKRILKIREDAVVIDGDGGSETLLLHPLAKKSVSRAPSRSAKNRPDKTTGGGE